MNIRTFFCRAIFLTVLTGIPGVFGSESSRAPEPGDLRAAGKVDFPVSCTPAAQAEFARGVALLHSFFYEEARRIFTSVAEQDPKCAMAHWGVAMTYFHPVWTPALPPDTFTAGQQEMLEATRLHAGTPRERQYVHALGELYKVDAGLTSAQRSMAYEKAMAELARDNPKDVEAQVFYAVALLSNAAPTDKTHAKQKQAIGILEPLFRTYPDHPGIAHYLIHATDSAALAQRGACQFADLLFGELFLFCDG